MMQGLWLLRFDTPWHTVPRSYIFGGFSRTEQTLFPGYTCELCVWASYCLADFFCCNGREARGRGTSTVSGGTFSTWFTIYTFYRSMAFDNNGQGPRSPTAKLQARYECFRVGMEDARHRVRTKMLSLSLLSHNLSYRPAPHSHARPSTDVPPTHTRFIHTHTQPTHTLSPHPRSDTYIPIDQMHLSQTISPHPRSHTCPPR